jgi:hypothetical protein
MSTHDLYEQRQNFYLTPSSTARGGIYFCVAAGLIAFFAGLFVQEGALATRAWGGFLFNLMFFFAISLAGIAFSAMQDVIGAKWGRPVMRLHESFASFLPVAALMFVIFFACIMAKAGHANEVFRWIKDPSILEHLPGKRDWLKPGFMIGRDIFALVVILALALWQLRLKVAGDVALVRGDRAAAASLGEGARAKLRYWSGPILVCYALTFSLLVFDLTMSLSPTWYSTLWGGWSFAVMMQTAMAALLLAMYALKRTHIGQHIRRQQFHDVGKLMHGFTIFFAYLTYAHVLTYWYTNVPEETQYFFQRMQAPWLGILIVAPILSFVFPLFALLPKASKWTAGLTIPICSAILFAQWLAYLLMVIPEVAVPAQFQLPWIEVGTFLGFLGMFLSAVFWFGKRYPMLALSDPLLAESMHEAH